jgi:ribosomal protein S12 methylthiotransferase accessory factor
MIGSLPPPLRRAVSPYTGIVGAVEECLATTCEPRLFQASAEVGRGAGLVGGRLDHLTGIGGTGSSRAGAASAAVGEAIERYSATYVPVERLVVASARELGDVAVAPGRFALFSARQHARAGFPYRPFAVDTRIAWIEGREIATGRAALLPAELVYLGRVPLGEGPIGYATSSGLACGDTAEAARARALLEILERDAFMIVWASRLTLPRVETAGPGSREVFDRSGLRFAAVDLSVLHRLPTILGIVRAPSGFLGALGVGAAAAPTFEQAWRKALGEAFAVRSAGAKLALLDPDRELGPRGELISSFDDHILYYADHDRARAAAFLDASDARTPADAIPPLEGAGPAEWVAALCDRVAAAGSSAYAVDVTSPDVAQLGLVVTRVVAPGLCGLDVPHDTRFLGGRRLYEAAATAGLRRDPMCEDDVNPDPHPFP